MNRVIEVYLPNHPKAYGEIRFVAKSSDSYNPEETAEKMAQLLECLYNEMPKVVIDRLVRDPRVINFRKMLEDKI